MREREHIIERDGRKKNETKRYKSEKIK